MKPERWLQIDEIYNFAIEIDRVGRDAFLKSACAGDEPLLRELESLLVSHDQAKTFIEQPVLAVGLQTIAEDGSASFICRRIGCYEVAKLIGAGGMGSVYLALRADDQYRKQVAIKVIKRGMDTEFILRRFRDERQILANLNHPNIAQLFDGGATEDGLPYYVMEYVEGESIDVYCDSHEMSIAERLTLFRSVCAAVHYAHQNLVVHLDIKPANILVTREGIPKLLDFGIARLLNRGSYEQTVYPTGAGPRLMTPSYGSPEQFRGETVTTASDTYSLGVLLYELLSGHRPYRLNGCSLEEASRMICHEQPRRPSTVVSIVEKSSSQNTEQKMLSPACVSRMRHTSPERLRRSLAGDLDNIVLKAMHKEPSRRYGSVEQFSEDLQRHSDGRPVTAQPDSVAYRALKFVIRHKVGTAAAALILVSLVGGALATLRQAQIARTERGRAERRFNDVRHLANSFLFEFHDAIKDLPGATPARELVVKKALEYLDSLSRESANDVTLQRELAAAYEKVGDVQGQFAAANLGKPQEALESYKKSLAIRTEVIRANSGDLDNQRQLAKVYGKLGNIEWLTGHPAEASETARKGLAVSEALSVRDPRNSADRKLLATSYLDYGWKLGAGNGDYPGGITSNRKAIAILEDLLRGEPGDKEAALSLPIAYSRLGTFLESMGRLPEALAAFQTSLSLREKILAGNPTGFQIRQHVAASHMTMGNVLAELNRPAEALIHQHKALTIVESLSEEDPKNMQLRQDRAGVLGNIGALLITSGDEEGAKHSLEEALDLLTSLPAAASSVVIRFTVAKDQYRMGDALASQAAKSRNGAAAKAYWRNAKTWYEKSLPVFIDLRDHGIATGPDAAMPDQVSTRIAKCNKHLFVTRRSPVRTTRGAAPPVHQWQ
jgi:non-specific serine/threonine protein kinase/serine/threonine-protein kinase